MSKHYIYTIIAAISMIATGCDTADFPYLVSEARVSSDLTEVHLGGEADDKTEINITADCDWTLTQESSTLDWLSLSATQGTAGTKTVVLTNKVANNSVAETTTLILTMTSNNLIRQTITVNRDRTNSSITTSTDRLEFDAIGGTNGFTVICSDTWELAEISKNDTWITATKEPTGTGNNAYIKVQVQANSGNERKYTLTVTDTQTNVTRNVEVIQAAYVTSLEIIGDTQLYAGVMGQTFGLTVRSSDPWTLNGDTDWVKDSDWVYVESTGQSKIGEAGIVTLSITVDRNIGQVRQRNLDFYITDKKSYMTTIVINQDGVGETLEFASGTSREQAFSETGGEAIVQIITNLINVNAWTSDQDSWCIPSYDDQNSRVCIEVMPNQTQAERHTTVTIGNNDTYVTLRVSQAAGTLAQLDAPMQASSSNSSVRVECKYQSVQRLYEAIFLLAETRQDLQNMTNCRIAQAERYNLGSTQGTFAAVFDDLQANSTYYVMALASNSIGESISEIIEVHTDNSTISIADTNLDGGNLTFDYAGGTKQVVVMADTQWGAITNASWCSLQSDPTGNFLNVTVAANTSSVARETQIEVFTYDGSARALLTVVQQGAPSPNPDDNNPPTIN